MSALGKREEKKKDLLSFLQKVCMGKPRRGRRWVTLPAPKSHNSFFPVVQELIGENRYQKFWASKYSVIFNYLGKSET